MRDGGAAGNAGPCLLWGTQKDKVSRNTPDPRAAGDAIGRACAALQEYLFACLGAQEPGYGAEVVEVRAMEDTEEGLFSAGPLHGLRGRLDHTELGWGGAGFLLGGRLTARVGL